MNRTERLAYSWLVEQCYTGIEFRSNKTPDFLTAQGKSFEVKTLHEKSIRFSYEQFEDLLYNETATILVFKDEPVPKAIIPIKDLKNRPATWGDIVIYVSSEHRGTVNLRFTDDEYDIVKQIALEGNQSIYSWIKHAILGRVATRLAYEHPEAAKFGIQLRRDFDNSIKPHTDKDTGEIKDVE